MKTYVLKLGKLELVVIQTQLQELSPALELIHSASPESLAKAKSSQIRLFATTGNDLTLHPENLYRAFTGVRHSDSRWSFSRRRDRALVEGLAAVDVDPEWLGMLLFNLPHTDQMGGTVWPGK